MPFRFWGRKIYDDEKQRGGQRLVCVFAFATPRQTTGGPCIPLGSLVFGGEVNLQNPAGWIGGIIGAVIVLLVYMQFTKRKASERMSRLCPTVLGIDEHTLHKGCRFSTTFYDLKNHCIFDIVEGKDSSSLEAFLLQLQGPVPGPEEAL